MRYAVISKGLTISQLQGEVKRYGGRNLRVASATKQVFCDLNDTGVIKLRAIGCIISKVGGVKATIMPPIITPPVPVAAAPVYSPEQLSVAAGIEDVRGIIQPPLYGAGMNLAIIGTGIRETHEKINKRVIYRKNYTSDPMGDGFNHDTGVCSVALAIVPLCNILNMKALDDKGEGSEEEVVLAIDDCLSLYDTNPEIAPSVINLSLGSPDEGDPNNPLRVACRAALDKGIYVFAAAGNDGPALSTILSPACERYVFAIGSCSYEPFAVSNFSGRGPTKEGLIKPDGILFGENIMVASSSSDTATIAKSGTSFSTPFVSAMAIMYHEGVYRRAMVTEPMIELPAVEMYWISIEDMVNNYLPFFCVKPEGVPMGKDYDYGWGLPFGPLMMRVMGFIPAVDISTVLGTMMPILALGILGMILVPMMKELK